MELEHAPWNAQEAKASVAVEPNLKTQPDVMLAPALSGELELGVSVQYLVELGQKHAP